ncbi:DUF2164 family protein [Enterobacter asburiae]|uniref:DUF2164 family protein n=1 Tax=Scandinavium sp. UTDF21-P1B TaxID=3446379 RepID=UPI003475FA23
MSMPELNKDIYNELSELITSHMMTEHELHLGQFESEALLDGLLKKLMPSIYNMAIEDAILSLRGAAEKIEEELDLRKIL